MLDVRETAGQSLSQRQALFLRGESHLLVLDTFEQVATAARRVGQLLMAALAPKVVVASRSAPRLSGERVVAVTPLSLPSPADPADWERITDDDAIRLCAERGSAAADFAISPRLRSRRDEAVNHKRLRLPFERVAHRATPSPKERTSRLA